nr:histone deacetylase 14 [Tanacetum cinerariifolium]
MAPPTRTDDQILPHIRLVPIGKSNCYLDVEKSQSNPIYKIVTARCYKCQLDEQWFDLTKDTLRDAIQITPVNKNKAFSSLSSSDALINDMGYPKVVRNLSNVVTNDMFQPWRALTRIINMCLTGKTSRIWEEFTQSIHSFIEDKKNLRKHKFHTRLDSLLHFPNKEPVLGYLKFNAKGTKREVFGMPIPGNLITADIQGESYYQEYLEKVAKHQRYLAGEQGSDPDSPAPKPAKATKKSKPSKPGLVTKRHKLTSSLRSVDESVAEGILEKEPRFDDEEADVHRALEKSLKSIYDAPRGPLPPVVIREVESGKYQPLPEVQGKGKAKVIDEHVALDLLTLQMPKKKSPADQFIFQRRTSAPFGSSGQDECLSLYDELGLIDSEVESDEDVPGIDAGVPDEGQAGPNPGDQDKGQAGPNPDEQDEGQVGPNPGDVATSQPLPSLVVHAGPNLEHMDLEVTDASTQPHPEQMDEGFTATAYPRDLVFPTTPTKDLSFGDLFFNDKPSKADNEKTTAETEVESMVSVIIQQD